VRLNGLILSLAAQSWPCAADTITFSDSEFADADWIHVESDTGNAASLAVGQVSTGGNPDAYQGGSHTWTDASSVSCVHLYVPTGGATVDPALGSITSVDFSMDASVFSPTFFDAAVGFRLAIEHDAVPGMTRCRLGDIAPWAEYLRARREAREEDLDAGIEHLEREAVALGLRLERE